MTTFRASPNGGAAWVTGGSKGIGRELVLALAREGYMVAATARGREDLEEVARAAHGLPGTVFAAIEDKVVPIALAVFNAGNYFPTKGERLDVANFVKTYEVNVFGVVNGLVPVVRRMQERRRGHVAIVGSVSSYFGWPTTAAYGATKAALNNMAESLKYDFDRMNIRIQMINPGFIDTPLTSKNSFAMPALMAPEKAAARIVAGLRSGGFEMTFPRRFTWFLKFLRILPQPIRYAFINRVTGWHKRPLSTRR
jgi:short-subunit dehydrogenase